MRGVVTMTMFAGLGAGYVVYGVVDIVHGFSCTTQTYVDCTTGSVYIL